MKKANTKIFLTIIFLFIILLAILFYYNTNHNNNNIKEENKICVLYKATSQNYTYINADKKKQVAKFEIIQNKDNLNVQFLPNFVITQPGETKNYWIEAYTNKKINESEITYIIKVNNYPLKTIKTKLNFKCIKYEEKSITNNNTNNNTSNNSNTDNTTNKKSYLQAFYEGAKFSIKLFLLPIILLILLIITLFFIIKKGRKENEKEKKNKTIKKQKEEEKKAKLEKLLEARIKIKKGLTLYQKIIIVLFIILIIILAIIAIQNSSLDLNMFTTTLNTNMTK